MTQQKVTKPIINRVETLYSGLKSLEFHFGCGCVGLFFFAKAILPFHCGFSINFARALSAPFTELK